MHKNIKRIYVEVIKSMGRSSIVDERRFEPAARELGIRYDLWFNAIDCGHYGIASFQRLK